MLVNGPPHIELFQVAGAKPLPEKQRTPDTDVCTHGNKHGSNIFIRDNAGNLIEFVQGPPPSETVGYLR